MNPKFITGAAHPSWDTDHAIADALGGYRSQQDRAVLQQAEARQREVPHEMDRLERALKGCAQGIETLASRLSESVVRSEPPTPAQTGSNSPTAVPQTPLGSRLQELTNTASILNERIHSLISRLEA